MNVKKKASLHIDDEWQKMYIIFRLKNLNKKKSKHSGRHISTELKAQSFSTMILRRFAENFKGL